jgi:hypothetical protein
MAPHFVELHVEYVRLRQSSSRRTAPCPWGTLINADLQLPDLTQIPASGGLRRTEAQPCSTNRFCFCWNGLGMLPGAWSHLSHGKISDDHAVDLR